MSQRTMVVDLDRCIGCKSCEVACKHENGVALGCTWNKVLTVGPTGTYPKLEMYYLPTMCQECKDAPCVKACPTGASYKSKDGVVLVDKEKCIGCQYCMFACPYGVRTFNEETKVVEKCTLCAHLQAAGKQPACVEKCPAGCRFVGDIDDPNSEVARVIKNAGSDSVHVLPDVGNQPSARYILHSKIATWKE
ncbi:MAG: Psr/DMSO reductase-like protein chain iron-sulfur binding subunit [Firmicutes bacterium]|nr:Psr/DMSO reductase-like protein chain iron-sulfur binding subunit [Bacillota bacterium]